MLAAHANGRGIVSQQLPTNCWILHAASVCAPGCMLLRSVGSWWAKFETGQTCQQLVDYRQATRSVNLSGVLFPSSPKQKGKRTAWSQVKRKVDVGSVRGRQCVRMCARRSNGKKEGNFGRAIYNSSFWGLQGLGDVNWVGRRDLNSCNRILCEKDVTHGLWSRPKNTRSDKQFASWKFFVSVPYGWKSCRVYF